MKRRTVIACLFFVAWLAEPRGVRATETWHRYRGHKYRLTPAATDWQQAEKHARDLGGHLVAIDDENEQEWLVETFGGSQSFWIGFSAEKGSGKWAWSGGGRSAYTNWYPGEPQGASEEYAVMNWREPGKWDARSRYSHHIGIVEVAPYGPAPEVPPGQVLFDLRSGGRCFGTLGVEPFEVATRYGTLRVPPSELKEIHFPEDGEEPGTAPEGPAATPDSSNLASFQRDTTVAATAPAALDQVITARFTCRGRLLKDEFTVDTKYGALKLRRADLQRIVFGPAAKKERPRAGAVADGQSPHRADSDNTAPHP